MPTLLYHTKLTLQNVTSTTSQTGYGADNLKLEAIARNWRATGAGAENLILDVGTSQSLGGVLVSDVNWPSATVSTSVDGSAYTARGTLTTYANDQGRRRGIFTLNGYTGRYIKLAISAGTPGDGLSYWRAGSAYVMKTAVTLAQAPNKGYSVQTVYAQQVTKLANFKNARAGTGSDHDEIHWNFTRKYQDSLDVLKTQLRAGTVLIDMGLPQFPHHVWPVTTYDNSHDRTYPKANSELSAVVLSEVV